MYGTYWGQVLVGEMCIFCQYVCCQIIVLKTNITIHDNNTIIYHTFHNYMYLTSLANIKDENKFQWLPCVQTESVFYTSSSLLHVLINTTFEVIIESLNKNYMITI